MKQINDILQELEHLINHEDLEDFIARGWIRPARDEQSNYIFEDVDVARVRLVCELHHDMELQSDALDVVLPLMDQLYETRAKFKILSRALEQEPEEIRIRISRTIKTLI